MRRSIEDILGDPEPEFWLRLGYSDVGSLRQQILVRTIRLANEVGPGSFNAKALCEAMGIAPASINYHFKNRESLLAEAAFVGYVRYVEMVWRSVESAPKDPEKRLRTWIETSIDIQVAMSGWGPVLNYPSTSLGITEALEAKFRAQMSDYAELHLARLIMLVGDVRRGRGVSDVAFALGRVPRAALLKNLTVVATTASIGWSVLGVAVWLSGRHLPSRREADLNVLTARAMSSHVDRMIREARGS